MLYLPQEPNQTKIIQANIDNIHPYQELYYFLKILYIHYYTILQFLKKHHVQELVEIVDSCECPVMCYGLKNDFRNELFEGSYYLLIYADKIEEIKTICWCGRKATMVARVVDGKIVKQGDQIVIGGNDMYVSLCRKHYNDGRLGPSK